MTGQKRPGKKVVGYGWTGTYRCRSDHRLGWVMPDFIAHGDGEALTTDQLKALGRITNREFALGDMWRVKVTLEPCKDKKGRYIVRRAVKPKKSVPAPKPERKSA